MNNAELFKLERKIANDDGDSKKKKYGKLDEMLSEKKDLAMDCKFLKAIPTEKEKKMINDFVDDFVDSKSASKTEIDIAKKILKIGKTFYEFGGTDSKLIPLFITHPQYDKLLSKYKKYEVEPEAFIPKKDFEKVEIKYQTLSNNLDKCYILNEDDEVPEGVAEKTSVEEFLKDVYKELGLEKDEELEIELSPKIDGVSINTGLKNSKFKDPTSRGDKKVGMFIKGLDGFKVADEENEKFGIQYEAFVGTKNRQRIAEALGLENYKSNRSAASGLINRLARTDSEEVTDLADKLYFYPIAAEDLDDKNYKETMEYIEKFGIVPADIIEREYVKGTKKELLGKIEKYYKKVLQERPDLSYSIDGVVITVVKKKYQEQLGRDGSTNNFQIAYKFDPMNGIGVVRNAWFSTGNMGFKTIMIRLADPVELNGSEYIDVHVLSKDVFESLDLHVGDEVKVKLTGDVIPTIVVDKDCKKNKAGDKLTLPVTCSYCWKPLVIVDSKHCCTNPKCEGNIIGRFVNFFEQIGLNDFDEGFAKTLYSKVGIRTLGELVEVKEEQLEKAGYNKKAKQFVKGIKNSLSELKDYELLGALGIPGLRKEMAKKILSQIDIDKLDGYSYAQLVEDLKKAKGIDRQATSFADYMIKEKEMIKKLLKLIDPKRTDFVNAKTVGFTGEEADDRMKKLIRHLGWTITDGKKFDILVTSSHKRTSKKMDVAKESGGTIDVYTMEEFFEKFDKFGLIK